MIGKRGERGSGISVLAARHDDDEGYVNHCWITVWLNKLRIQFYEHRHKGNVSSPLRR